MRMSKYQMFKMIDRLARDPAKSAQLSIDDDADGVAPHSEVRSSSAYYAVIAGAVSKLPNNTPQARQALYDRAGIALGAELLDDPEISDEQVAGERLALERAIRKVEDDERRKEQPPSPPRQSNRGPFSLLLSLFHVFRRR
jgi:hypothetical protein